MANGNWRPRDYAATWCHAYEAGICGKHSSLFLCGFFNDSKEMEKKINRKRKTANILDAHVYMCVYVYVCARVRTCIHVDVSVLWGFAGASRRGRSRDRGRRRGLSRLSSTLAGYDADPLRKSSTFSEYILRPVQWVLLHWGW